MAMQFGYDTLTIQCFPFLPPIRTIDLYHVYYRKESEEEWDQQVVETVNNTFNHMVSEQLKVSISQIYKHFARVFTSTSGKLIAMLSDLCNGSLLEQLLNINRYCKVRLNSLPRILF